MESDHYTLGAQCNLGSEADMRRHGLCTMDIDGAVHAPTLGHKGQEGSDPNYPDQADHMTTVFKLEADGRVHRRCSCGLQWSFLLPSS